MQYIDFYDLCVYVNRAWKADLTTRELAGAAFEFYEDYVGATDGVYLATLKSNLAEDAANGDETAKEWLERIGR